MKRLSIRLVLLAFVLILTGSGFTKKTPPAAPATAAKAAFGIYNWFEEPGSYYFDQNDIDTETWEQWMLWGVLVDQNPGGTVVAKGYGLGNYPPVGPPTVTLYAHF